MLSEPVIVVAKLARAFDALGIRYLVGGSLASSVYGIPRATQDVDLVAAVQLSQVDAITSALGDEFYVDADMIRDAIKRRASFNVIHLDTMFKADVFIQKGDSWSRGEMERARTEQLDMPGGQVTIRFASPEDTLLHKLIWYKLGDEMSDRQWSDILGVLKIQGMALDQDYLDRWAPLLDVHVLLARARQEHSGAT
ncbi:hypothetical protein L6R50_20820 [Myxococcota bacterium]|nr:hypothetical protein [Myxococcota bacterium]